MEEERWEHLLREGPPVETSGSPWWVNLSTIPARCPICGDECSGVYVNSSGDVLGCDQCVFYTPIHDFALGDGAEGGDI